MLSHFIIEVLPFIAVSCALVYLPYAFLITKHRGKQSVLFHFVRYSLLGYCFSLIYLTLLWYYPNITFRPEYHFLNLKPFIWIQEVYDMGQQKMMEQLILNIGMFIPMGLLLPLAFRRIRHLWSVSFLVFASTVGIETVQYFMGRSADIDDVIMNFIGGIFGYIFFKVLDQLLHKKAFWHRIAGRTIES